MTLDDGLGDRQPEARPRHAIGAPAEEGVEDPRQVEGLDTVVSFGVSRLADVVDPVRERLDNAPRCVALSNPSVTP
jgi:hypothetical protein